MKDKKKTGLNNYIYIRIRESEKDRMKEKAVESGMSMTVWARQILIKALNAIGGNNA